MSEERYKAIVQAEMQGIDRFMSDAARAGQALERLNKAAADQGKNIYGSTPTIPTRSQGAQDALNAPLPTQAASGPVQAAAIKTSIAQLENQIAASKRLIAANEEDAKALTKAGESTKQLVQENERLTVAMRAAEGPLAELKDLSKLVTSVRGQVAAMERTTAEQEKQARELAKANAQVQASTLAPARTLVPEVTASSSDVDLANRKLAQAENKLAAATEKRIAADLLTQDAHGNAGDLGALEQTQASEARAGDGVITAKRALQRAVEEEVRAAQRAAEFAQRNADVRPHLTGDSSKADLAQARADVALNERVRASEKVAALEGQAARGIAGANEKRQIAIDQETKASIAYVAAQRQATHLMQNEGKQREASQQAIASANQVRVAVAPVAEGSDVDLKQRNLDVANFKAEEATNNLAAARARAAAGESAAAAEITKLEFAEVAATNAVVRAKNQLAGAETIAARKAELESRQTSSTGLTRQIQQFQTGFKGQRDAPYAEQIGQAFKFSVFYGTAYKLLFGLTQVFQQSLAEGIAFQQALSDLTVAAGKPKDELNSLAEDLGKEATRSGASASQGVEIGAQSLGLYGAAGKDTSADTQRQVATISARVVSQLAIGSKQDPVELGNNIAAITNALGLGAAGQFRVADLDAYLTKRFGVAQGSTFDALAQSATVGKAAGFTDEQLFAISAELKARTGQSSSAVGGYMAQFFSRGGQGSVTNVAQQHGIDTTQTLAKITEQLAEVYRTGSPNERAQIAASEGRGKSQSAVLALLNEFPTVLHEADRAKTGATGSADAQFEERMRNIGGQILVVTGDLKEFAHLLGDSGMLGVLGLAIEVFKSLLEATNGVLGQFDRLPNSIRTVIASLALFELGLRVSTKGGLVSAGTSLFGRASLLRAGAVTPASRTAQYLTATGHGAGAVPSRIANTTAGMAATGEAAVASRVASRGIAGFGKAAYAAIGPVGLAIGGLLALSTMKESVDKLRSAQEAAALQLSDPAGPGYGGSGTSYRSQANALGEARKQVEESRHGFGAKLQRFNDRGAADSNAKATLANLDARIVELNRLAAEADRRANSGSPSESLITGFSSEAIKTSLDAITQGGGGAISQLNALTLAINGLGKESGKKSTKIKTNQLGEALIESVAGGVKDSSTKDFRTGAPSISGDSIHNALDPYIQKNLAPLLKKYGVKSFTDLDKEAASKVAAELAKNTSAGVIGSVSTAEYEKVKKQVQDNIYNTLIAQAKKFKDAVSGTSLLSSSDTASAAISFADTSDARTALRPDTDYKGRIADARQKLAGLQNLSSRNKGDDLLQTEIVEQEIHKAKSNLIQGQIDEIQAVREAAVQRAKNQKDATAIGRRAVDQMVRLAVSSGDSDILAKVLSTAGRGAIAIAQREINKAIALAKYARRLEVQMAAAAKAMQSALQGALGGVLAGVGALPGDTPGVKQLQGLKDSLSFAQFNPTPDQIPKTPAAKKPKKPKGPEPDTAAQINAARAAAEAARQRSPIAEARAAVTQASADLHDAKKNTVAYYNALGAYYNARASLTDALRENATAREAANAARQRSPIAVAQAAVHQAQAEIRDAQKGTVDYYNALASYYDARVGLTDAVRANATAREAAGAARLGGPIAAAEAAVHQAQAEMRDAARGTADYYTALGAYYNARSQLDDALRQYSTDRRKLASDLSDPVAQARIDLEEARKKLARDRSRGRGKVVTAEDQLGIRQAQLSLEGDRFSQRLSDAQTAEQLGRTSHAAYITYLDHEHNRLKAIKHKSRQQTDELNQIDGLLKEAQKQMTGAFNIGNITLPTAYQVRRYVQEQAKPSRRGLETSLGATPGGSRSVSNSSTTIYIDGADVGKVQRIIEDTVGKSSRVVTANGRRQ